MGGCRCNFRGCDNSTSSRPGMHFFHFPTKDTDRCLKWIKFSNNPSFKEMEDAKLKNRNVCEEHFRVKMFMNIRKERLIRFALPTLLKTKINGKTYDLEKMLNSQCDIDDLNVNSILDERFDDKFLVEPEDDPTRINAPAQQVTIDKVFTLNERNIDAIPIEFEGEKSPKKEKVEVLSNKLILTPIRRIKRPIAVKEEPVLTPVPAKKSKVIKILNSSNLMKTITSKPIQIHTTISPSQDPKIVKQDVKSPKQDQEHVETILKITEERNKAVRSEQQAQQELRDCQNQVYVLKLKIEELEEKLKVAEAQKYSPPKTTTKGIQTDPDKKIIPKASPSPNAQTTPKPGTLSKPQLFNGIKRYLSNAMATLLKMEMFGNSEREWKADEKKISCEIMRLGTETYEFFTDEWRLRLPSKTEVNSWLQDNADDEDDDLF